jgi:NAD(P)-dependent dehydrogenase (short-subunit alcohol dehydrogenase family)
VGAITAPHCEQLHHLDVELRDLEADQRPRRQRVGDDVLVNNAGIFGVKAFLESTTDDLERFFETNVKGTFLMTQAVVPAMIAAGGGSIINVGTVLVEQGMSSLPVSAAMASKGGVHALTVSLAAELARHRIRVNTLAPGIIRTPLIGDGADSMAAIHTPRLTGASGVLVEQRLDLRFDLRVPSLTDLHQTDDAAFVDEIYRWPCPA